MVAHPRRPGPTSLAELLGCASTSTTSFPSLRCARPVDPALETWGAFWDQLQDGTHRIWENWEGDEFWNIPKKKLWNMYEQVKSDSRIGVKLCFFMFFFWLGGGYHIFGYIQTSFMRLIIIPSITYHFRDQSRLACQTICIHVWPCCGPHEP